MQSSSCVDERLTVSPLNYQTRRQAPETGTNLPRSDADSLRASSVSLMIPFYLFVSFLLFCRQYNRRRVLNDYGRFSMISHLECLVRYVLSYLPLNPRPSSGAVKNNGFFVVFATTDQLANLRRDARGRSVGLLDR